MAGCPQAAFGLLPKLQSGRVKEQLAPVQEGMIGGSTAHKLFCDHNPAD